MDASVEGCCAEPALCILFAHHIRAVAPVHVCRYSLGFNPPDLAQLESDKEYLAAWLADIKVAVQESTGVENVLITSLTLPAATTSRRSLIGSLAGLLGGRQAVLDKAVYRSKGVVHLPLSGEDSVDALGVNKEGAPRLSAVARRRRLSQGLSSMGLASAVRVRNYASASIPKVKVRGAVRCIAVL